MSKPIHPDEWLMSAKSLPVGQTRRVRHGRESRSNMVISNKPDRYTAYCHACQRGGIVLKEHAYLGKLPEPEPLEVPTDLIPVHEHVGAMTFLASKNIPMLPTYTNGLLFSPSRRRIIINTPQGVLGRHIGSSPAKWITYNKQTYASVGYATPDAQMVVITEDTLSAWKTGIVATELGLRVQMFAALGSQISTQLMLRLLAEYSGVPIIVWSDGDKGGEKFRDRWAQQVRAMNLLGGSYIPAKNYDPKDYPIITVAEILKSMAAYKFEPGRAYGLL